MVEPRQAFEEVVTLILKCIRPSSRRVRVYRGDGGIDSFTGFLGDGGEADVYQVKYFVGQWGDPQKQQIREAHARARQSKDYKLGTWTLCVPVRLTKEDLRWFDEWRSKQDGEIQVMDGDDLSRALLDERCGAARNWLREQGVLGLQSGKPQLQAVAFIRQEIYQRTGLTATLILKLENRGDRSAKNIKVVVTHTETNCVANREPDAWENCDDGRINPRSMRYGETLNPGDDCVMMSIPLAPATPLPFAVGIKVTADDCPPSMLVCEITEEQIGSATPIRFQKNASKPFVAESARKRKQVPPTSPGAKELLDLILSHPVPGERGLTEILQSPVGVNEAALIPNTTAAGGAMSLRKSVLRAAVAELVQLGWLTAPEGDGRIQIYELVADAGE